MNIWEVGCVTAATEQLGPAKNVNHLFNKMSSLNMNTIIRPPTPMNDWLSEVHSGFGTNACCKKWKQKWQVSRKNSNHNVLQWHRGYFSKASKEAHRAFIRMTWRLCFGGCGVWAGSVNKYIAHILTFLKPYCSMKLLSHNDIHYSLQYIHVTVYCILTGYHLHLWRYDVKPASR